MAEGRWQFSCKRMELSEAQDDFGAEINELDYTSDCADSGETFGHFRVVGPGGPPAV